MDYSGLFSAERFQNHASFLSIPAHLIKFQNSFISLQFNGDIMNVKIEESWKEVLKDEFDKPYFHNIIQHLKTEKAQGKTIYPPGSLIFNAFNKTPINNVKAVILGQDPYHGAGQAH